MSAYIIDEVFQSIKNPIKRNKDATLTYKEIVQR